MPQDNDLSFALVLLICLSGLGCALLNLTRRNRDSLRLQMYIFLAALGARFLLAIIIYEFDLVRVLGDEDGSGWYIGVKLMNFWTARHVGWLDLPATLAESYQHLNGGYGYLVGALFYLTSAPARLPAAALNCFFGALTCVFTFRIADNLFSRWVAVRVGWVICCFPSLIVWSAQTVKEPVVILLETIALYACVQLKLSGFAIRYVVLCCAAISLLFPFRFYAAYLAAVALLLTLIVPQIGKRKSSFVAGLGIATLIIPLAISSGILARNEAQFERFDIGYIRTFQRGIAFGQGSGVVAGYDLKTPDGLAMSIVVGAAYLLLAPFPWELGGASLRMLLTLPEMLVWWSLFFWGVVPGVWFALRRRFGEMQPLLIFIVGLGLLYSLMFGNVGLIVRQRAQLLPWLLIFAMVGLEQYFQRRQRRRQIMAAQLRHGVQAT